MFSLAKTAGIAKRLRSNQRKRRLTAIAGIGYHVLVAVDGSKESWKALQAVLYFLDDAMDSLTTVTIRDEKTPKDIEKQIKKFIDASNIKLPSKRLSINIQNKNTRRAKERLIEIANKGQFDLFALGMQGRKNSKMNRLKVFGSCSDLSVRAVKCSTLIARSIAELPAEGESAVFVVAVDGTTNSDHAFSIAKSFMKEDDFLYVVHVSGPHGDGPEVPIRSRGSFLNMQFEGRMDGLKNWKFERLHGKSIAKELIDFCNEKEAHFLMCGADEMDSWVKHELMLGSVSEMCVKESECFVITTQLNVIKD